MLLTVNAASRRVLHGLLILLLLGGFAAADSNVPAPQFTARTLDGRTVTSSSFRGSVVLLQFWTTWCPVCRRDQPAVDNIQSAFAGSGLVVLAVNDGEPEATVRQYLQANPRSCEVLLSEGHSIAARFGVHGYPHYVVIDREGNVTASQSGGGGEAHLRYLLRTAGMPSKPGTLEAGNRGTSSAAGSGIEPKLITVPPIPSAATAKPLPKTVFIFANGDQLEADHYMLHSDFLYVTAGGQEQSIPLGALDLKKTIAVNHERGIELKIPKSGSEIFLAF